MAEFAAKSEIKYKTYQKHVRVVTGGLVGGRTVKVPLLQLGHGGRRLVEGHGLRPETAIAVNPDVYFVSSSQFNSASSFDGISFYLIMSLFVSCHWR